MFFKDMEKDEFIQTDNQVDVPVEPVSTVVPPLIESAGDSDLPEYRISLEGVFLPLPNANLPYESIFVSWQEALYSYLLLPDSFFIGIINLPKVTLPEDFLNLEWEKLLDVLVDPHAGEINIVMQNSSESYVQSRQTSLGNDFNFYTDVTSIDQALFILPPPVTFQSITTQPPVIPTENHSPTARNDFNFGNEGNETVFSKLIPGNVLSNDSDPDFNVLSVTNPGKYTGKYGTLTLETDGKYSYAISDSLKAVDSLNIGQSVVDVFRVNISDNSSLGALGASSELTITINGTNDAPVANTDTGIAREGNSTKLSGQAKGNVLINDSDVDNSHSSLTATLNEPAIGEFGTISFNSLGGFLYTVDDKNATVDALNVGQSIDEVYSYSVHDNNPAGDPKSASSTLTITINGINDSPVLSNDGNSITYTEQESEPSAINAGITLKDVDNSNLLSAEIKITAGFFDGDTLNFIDQGSITGVYDPDTGILTLSGSDSVANYQAALQSITFTSTSDNPDNYGNNTTRTISWQVDDGGVLDHASNVGSSTINVTAVNDAPQISDAADVAEFTEQGSAVALDSNISLIDFDDLNLEGATITIVDYFAGDTLNFSPQSGITGSYLNGVLTLTGPATVAQYQAALQSITYSSNSDNPDEFGANPTREISWTVNDGDVNSSIANSTINITAINDAPIIQISGAFNNAIDLSSLTTSQGFVINGVAADDQSGWSVSGAGDINHDGIDDVIIGAHEASPGGASYVVFGKSVFSSPVELSSLDGSNGFVINAAAASDQSGRSVSAAGDVNGDGIDDVIIGSNLANPNSKSDSGASYVIFGSENWVAPTVNLAVIASGDGSQGFAINGVTAGDQSGRIVNRAGDVNGDGFDDVIIGAYHADPNGSNSGASYVVFGKDSFPGSFNLSAIDGSNGFVIKGVAVNDESGIAVSTAGDINGDGFDDVVIGAIQSVGVGAGVSYVVFGNNTGVASIDLSTLDGNNGFVIPGLAASDRNGGAVSFAGDINGDGFDDVIIGAYAADPNGGSSGASYVVFGKAGGFTASFDLNSLDGSNGFVINGVASNNFSGWSLSGAGDVNGDGIDDVFIGAHQADPNSKNNSGASYVVFGSTSGFAPSIKLSDVAKGIGGFAINGAAAGDQSGYYVNKAGDVNGDGIDDVIIGANLADPNGSASGASYVVFGQGPQTNEGVGNTATIKGVSLSDVDAGNNLVTLTLSIASGEGSLSLGSLTDNNGSDEVFETTDTLANINAALSNNGITYTTPNGDFNGTVALNIEINDNGFHGDGGQKIDTEIVNIIVNSVNDEPSGADKTVNTFMNVDYTFATSDFGFSDVEPNAFARVKITYTDDDGEVYANDVLVASGGYANIGDTITFKPTADFHGLTSFTFQVEDDGGTDNGGVNLDQSANTITVNVLECLAPTITSDENSFDGYTFTDSFSDAYNQGVLGDGLSLREAIILANHYDLPGDDTICLGNFTYTINIAGTNEDDAFTGDLDITGSLIIENHEGGNSTIAADDGFSDRLFDVQGNGTKVEMTDLTIQDAQTAVQGAGIRAQSETELDLTNVTLQNNETTAAQGGGIYATNATVNVTSSDILNNSAAQEGGGLIFTSGTVGTITDSTISGNSTSDNGGGLHINLGASVTIEGSTFESNKATGGTGSGSGGGGIYAGTNSDVTISNSFIKNNEVTANASDGGGINALSGNSLTIQNTEISGNVTKTGQGGGVYIGGLTTAVNITDSQILNNSATKLEAGGIMITHHSGSPVTVVNVTGSEVSGNSSDVSNGGGIVVNLGATTTITDTTISGNTAKLSGGGIYAGSDSVVTVSDSHILSNTATTVEGGGIYESSAADNLTITNTEISLNKAVRGGGVYVGATIIDISDSIISNNSVTSQGGGLFFSGSDATVTNTEISGNTATASGGGVRLQSGATVDIITSTISGNTSLTSGGGIIVDASGLNVDASTISGNKADQGGGIYVNTSVAATKIDIDNSTITNNTATTATNPGGGIFHGNGALNLYSTIVAQNTGDLDIRDGTTTTVSSGYNLIGNGSNLKAGFALPTDKVGTSAIPIDAKLDVLADNGGPTQTHALLQDSPAIDAGNPGDSGNDQRGAPPVGTRDIGAYEYNSLTVTTFNDENDLGNSYNFANSFTAAFNDASFNGLSLREAIILANHYDAYNDGQVDIIQLKSETYALTIVGNGENDSLTGDLDITNSVVIKGSSSGSSIIDASNGGFGDRLFHAYGAVSLEMSNVTIQNAHTSELGGGLFVQGVDVELTNVSIQYNTTSNSAGGLYAAFSDVTIQNSTFSNNIAGGHGGGILADTNFSFTIVDSTISTNTANDYGGGGLYLVNQTSNIDNTEITNNKAGIGGGIDVVGGVAILIMSNSTLTGNNSNQGGALDIRLSASAQVSDSTFSNNINGGGIAVVENGNLSVVNSTITDNDSKFNGGGILAQGANIVTIDGSTISNNEAGFNGAGVYAFFSQSVSIDNNSNISNNTAAGQGGGIWGANNTNFTIEDSTISTNTANNYQGGGLFLANQTSSIDNTYITNNIAAGIGGGIDVSGSTSLLTLTNSTLSGNTSNQGGGLDVRASASAQVSDSTFSNNINGGGIAVVENANLSVVNSTITGNDSTFNGGGILIQGANVVSIDNSTISNNEAAAFNGGGVYVFATPSVAIDKSTISNNTAAGSGGGIDVVGSTSLLTLTNSTLSGNTANLGGGLDVRQAASAQVSDSIISDNIKGGGIVVVENGNLSVVNSTITGNDAQFNGGGIFIQVANVVTIESSTISNNEAGSSGAGILAFLSQSVSIDTTTISNNTAAAVGGGIVASTNVSFTIEDSTISGNIANTGGGVFVSNQHIEINDTVISDNVAVTGGGIFLQTATIAQSGNTFSGNIGGDIVIVPPVFLDLNGDGIHLQSAHESKVFIALDDSKVATQIAWVTPDDGVLVFNYQGESILHKDQIAFTSYQEGAKTDLEGLKAFDSNHDGQLSKTDDNYVKFGVWQDGNNNGLVDNSEFMTLAQRSISAISLISDQNEQVQNGNVIHGMSSYHTEDGSSFAVADVSLKVGSIVKSETLNTSDVLISQNAIDLSTMVSQNNTIAPVPAMGSAPAAPDSGSTLSSPVVVVEHIVPPIHTENV